MLLETILIVLLIVGIIGLLFIRNTLLSILLTKHKKEERHVSFQTAESERTYGKSKASAKIKKFWKG